MWSSDNNVYFNGRTNNGLSSYPVIATSSSGVITPPTGADDTGTLKSIRDLQALSNVFYVDSSGNMYATAGQIGGFTIGKNQLKSTSGTSSLTLNSTLVKFTDGYTTFEAGANILP